MDGAKRLGVSELVLIKRQFCYSQLASALNDTMKVDVRNTFYDDSMKMMTAHFTLLGDAGPVYEWPDGWKEALKERFAPDWYKRRNPVKYKRFQVGFVYPSVKIPDTMAVFSYASPVRRGYDE